MITPEPPLGRLHYVYEYALAYDDFPVPAAGHLGVIEEACPLPHDVDLLTLWPAVLPCPRCGAAV